VKDNVVKTFTLLPNPQMNGGLLVSVKEDSLEEVKKILVKSSFDSTGKLIPRQEKYLFIKPA
jgi:selenide,water dikinase